MEENNYVVYYESCDTKERFYVGIVNNEEDAKQLTHLYDHKPGMLANYVKLNYIPHDVINNFELGREVSFYIGSETFRTSEKCDMAWIYNKKYENECVYINESSPNWTLHPLFKYIITFYLHERYGERALIRAENYYKEITQDILLNKTSVKEAVKKINDRLEKGDK